MENLFPEIHRFQFLIFFLNYIKILKLGRRKKLEKWRMFRCHVSHVKRHGFRWILSSLINGHVAYERDSIFSCQDLLTGAWFWALSRSNPTTPKIHINNIFIQLPRYPFINLFKTKKKSTLSFQITRMKIYLNI